MWKLIPLAAALLLKCDLPLNGETITGNVRIERKLTKRSVTAPVAIYQRGSVTGSQAESGADPLDFERSHVAVWIEREGPGGGPNARMTQTGRKFSPDLVVIAAGASVSFPNLDPVFHNVFSLSKIKSFDLGNYAGGQDRSVAFPRPGIVFVNCHLHANMSGTIVVTPNRWHTVVSPDGSFRIEDIPAGKYSVVAWHKAAGIFREPVEVAQGAGAAVSFFIPLAQQPE